MTKDEICRDYMLLSERIAEEYSDRHVPSSVQAYYLLCELLAAGSFESFQRAFGKPSLEVKTVAEGKRIMNFGNLDDFEIAALGLYSESLR